MRQQIYTIRLFRTTALFIRDHPVFFLESGPIGRQNELVAQLNRLVGQINHQLLKPPNVWCKLCIQTQGDFSRWWFICATRWSNCTTAFSRSCQQNHLSRSQYQFVMRVVLPRPQVVLNKQIRGPYKTNLWSYINDDQNCATQYTGNSCQESAAPKESILSNHVSDRV